MMLNCHPQNLGALQMPASCDAYLVTSQRMLPDGSIGVFVGDYQLTAADLAALEAWRINCINQRQAQQDAELAKRAVELAAQPIQASPFSIGPNTATDPAPSVSLAVNYVNSISDPALRDVAKNAVITTLNQNPTIENLTGSMQSAQPAPGSGGAVTGGGDGGGTVFGPGSGTVLDAGFPTTGGVEETDSKLPLLALGLALALFS